MTQTATQTTKRLIPERRPLESGVLRLASGESARLEDGALALRDREGRLLVRFADGCAEIIAPEKDLVLSAPKGRVVVNAATDLVFEAGRDLTHRGGRKLRFKTASGGTTIEIDPRRVHVNAKQVEVEARNSRLVSDTATVLARQLNLTAESAVQHIGRYELEVDKLVETARESYRVVRELADTRLGRARTVVEGIFNLHTRRTEMISTQETSIDGERILLG
ncbi:DUF3540 domain-containing protein [Endomicrobium sp. AH-315-J14]|nr:DUF3540 domain-containing protein [Endomicrobium sp. AH-315-J14]